MNTVIHQCFLCTWFFVQWYATENYGQRFLLQSSAKQTILREWARHVACSMAYLPGVKLSLPLYHHINAGLITVTDYTSVQVVMSNFC